MGARVRFLLSRQPPSGADTATASRMCLASAGFPSCRNRRRRTSSYSAWDAGAIRACVCGISTIGAATLIAEIGDITRFNTAARFAAWSGTAPLDASSGRNQRHRLNRRGNRQVNRVLHTAILTQLNTKGPAADYTTRRLQQGKTKNEAIRAATRHLAANIWRQLHNQQN